MKKAAQDNDVVWIKTIPSTEARRNKKMTRLPRVTLNVLRMVEKDEDDCAAVEGSLSSPRIYATARCVFNGQVAMNSYKFYSNPRLLARVQKPTESDWANVQDLAISTNQDVIGILGSVSKVFQQLLKTARSTGKVNKEYLEDQIQFAQVDIPMFMKAIRGTPHMYPLCVMTPDCIALNLTTDVVKGRTAANFLSLIAKRTFEIIPLVTGNKFDVMIVWDGLPGKLYRYGKTGVLKVVPVKPKNNQD